MSKTNAAEVLPATEEQGQPEIPDSLWSKAEVAAYLNYKPATVDKVVCKPGFPKPIRLTEGRRGHPRWFPDDIREWARRQQRRAR